MRLAVVGALEDDDISEVNVHGPLPARGLRCRTPTLVSETR